MEHSVFEKFLRRFSHFIRLSLVGGLILGSTGCEQQKVESVPRPVSDRKPELIRDGVGWASQSTVQELKTTSTINFFHQDHFAAIVLKIPALLTAMDSLGRSESQQLIDWLQNQLASLVGSELAVFERIEKIWVIVDRDQFVFNGESQQSPLVMIVDFKSGLSSEAIQNIPNKRPWSNQNTSEVQFVELSPNRLAIGSEQQLAKLRDPAKLNNDLIRQFEETDPNADVRGAMIMRPIRRSLESILGLAANFGDAGQSLARIPEVLQGVRLNFYVNHSELLDVDLNFNRANDAEEMMQLVTSTLTPSNNSNGLGMDWGSLLMPSGNPLPSNGQAGESETLKSFNNFTSEIKENDLLNYFQQGPSISIQLKTPSNSMPLINALMSEARQAFYLEARKEQLRRIAIALQAYQEKYGVLPGSRSSQGDDLIPAQFSWRVALLPFLDEQELYQRFNFSEPWNSSYNLEVAHSIPDVFAIANSIVQPVTENHSKVDQAIPDLRSCFQIVEGATAVYRNDRFIPRLEDIEDQLARTAIVVEVGGDLASVWTEPTPIFLKSIEASQLGPSGEPGILLIDANFKPRHLIQDPKNISIMLSSEPGESISRSAFLNF